MPEENPYRYEGAAEPPLQTTPPPNLSMIQILQVSWKGTLAGVIAGVVLGIIIDPEIVGAVLILSLFVLIPVAIFGLTLYWWRDLIASQFCFWLSAAPLAIYFILLLYDDGADAGVVRDIGRAALIGYSLQLIPAAVIMHFQSAKELASSQNSVA